MTSKQPFTNLDDSDIKQFIQMVTRNYRFFIIGVAAAVVLAFVAIRFMEPKYKISSSLLVKEDNQRPEANMTDFLNSNMFGINQNFQNELWVIKSGSIVEQTIRNLDLTVSYYQKKRFQNLEAYDVVPFRVLLMQNHVQPVNVQMKISIQDENNFKLQAKGKNVLFKNFNTGDVEYVEKKWKFEEQGRFGELIETSDMAFVVQIDSTYKHAYDNISKDRYIYNFVLEDPISLTDRFKKQLEFRVVDRLATVIEVTAKSPSVKKGKNIVNEIMNVYSQQNLERKNHLATITINYIEQQLSEISDSLSITEDNLQRFRSSNQLLNVTEQSTGIMEQHMNLQNQMAELMTRKRYYDYVADYLANNEDFENMIVPASMGISDQLLNNLMSELITAQAQRSNLIQNNQELNPLVQKLGIQIENLKETISENITEVRKTTDISIDEMNKRIQQVENAISRLPATQRQLGGIEREFRLNEAIYNYLLEKRAEAKITQASNMPDNIIIESAQMVGDGPVWPNQPMIYLIALFLGLAIPFGYLTMKEMVTNKIESQETLERLTSSPVLGKIMHNHRKTGNVIFEFPKSIISESFRTLRTNLEFQFRGMPRKIIMITSSIEGEGKSFNALNLSMSYAHVGRRTLLMDFDLRKPSHYFPDAKESPLGLNNYYTNSISPEDIILQSPYENLDYIQTGPISANPTELIDLNKTEVLLSNLKNRYDCIVLDTSPLAQVSDAYLLMDYADIKIVIVRYNYSLKKVFALTMKDLKQKNMSNICIVMNDNRIYSDQYGYGYGYKSKKLEAS